MPSPSDKRNVLFINHSIRDGGPGRSLFYLLKYLDRDAINPFVLIPAHNVFSEQMAELGLERNLIVDPRFPENIMRPVIGQRGGGSLEGTLARTSLAVKALSIFINVLGLMALVLSSPFMLRRRRISLIYCNGTLAKIAGSLMGLLGGVPVIWHVRNIQQRPVMKALMNTLSRLSSVRLIICVSMAAARPFAHRRGDTIVINNGVDMHEFNPSRTRGALRKEFGLGRGVFVVGSTGRIVPRKGYDRLISAAVEMRDMLDPEAFARVRFVVVGDTPHFFRIDHLGELKALVSSEGLEQSFIFTGYRGDVRPYLKDFDVFVIPSNYPDPFPRSVIEAMAFSLPVVGFAQGGIAESVVNGVTGLLQDGSDMGEMARNILSLHDDPERRKAMGKEGRARVRELYQAPDIAARIGREIMGLLG